MREELGDSSQGNYLPLNFINIHQILSKYILDLKYTSSVNAQILLKANNRDLEDVKNDMIKRSEYEEMEKKMNTVNKQLNQSLYVLIEYMNNMGAGKSELASSQKTSSTFANQLQSIINTEIRK